VLATDADISDSSRSGGSNRDVGFDSGPGRCGRRYGAGREAHRVRWNDRRPVLLDRDAARPGEAVQFNLLTLRDARFGLNPAH
jgi:hypothetical protein